MSLRILVQPYNNFAQNPAGGVQTRVQNYLNAMSKLDCQIEYFDKTRHKLQDWDLIHFFKLSIEHYDLMMYAKNKGLKIVTSSIIPLKNGFKIRTHRILGKLLPLHTILDMSGKMLETSDIILTQSNEESKFIQDNYGIPSILFKTFPNGLSPHILNGDPTLAKNKYGSKPYVLIVGRIDSNKNQLNVIKALKDTDIPLIIVGGADPAEPSYFDKCKNTADTHTVFTGWIPQHDPLMASLFAAAKVVVLPSYRETFGNVILEGGATENNVVYSRNLPINELNLGRGTWTIDPNDVNDIRNTIIKAYHSPIVPDLKQRILDNFSWDAIAAMHLELFYDLVNHG